MYQMTYDGQDNPEEQNSPMGATSGADYSDSENPHSPTSAKGDDTGGDQSRWNYTYDDQNNLTVAKARATGDASEVEYRYCWTGVGQIHRIDPVTATGTTASNSTDPDREVKANGSVKSNAARCDADSGQGNDSLFTYNSRHEQTGVNKPAGGDQTMTYDALSRLKSVTDGRGVTIEYRYDGYDRVVEADYSGNGASQTVQWSYDLAGNKTELRDGNDNDGTESPDNVFEYDELNRLTREEGQGPSSGTDYSYDPAGNVTSIEVDGEPEATTYTYNPVNLVATVDDQRPGSSNKLIAFGYDKKDKRRSTYFALANGETLAQKTKWDDDGQPTCMYSYRGPAGTINEQGVDPGYNSCPNATDNRLITFYQYQYNDLINGASKRTSSKHAMLELDGHVTLYEYDDLMRLESADTDTALSGGNDLRRFAYTYDRHSNLVRENSAGTTPGLETGNLWAAHNGGDEICAAMRTTGTTDPGLSCDSTTSGQTSYNHDAAGNMLTASGGSAATLGGFTGSYNLPGQTASIDPPGAAGAQDQEYDGVMQDRRTLSGPTQMSYGFSGDVASRATDSGGGDHDELFVRDPGGTLLAMIDYTGGSVGEARFYLTDDQDSIMATVTDAGTTNAVTRYLYEPYGQTIRSWVDPNAGTGSSKYTEDGTASAPSNDYNPFGYVSGYTEPDSELIKFGTRYYAPQLALWSQHDPEDGDLENPLGLPPAQYVRRNPVNFEDPTGRECKYMGDCEDLGGSNETVDACLKGGVSAATGTAVWSWWTGGAVAFTSTGAFVATTIGCGVYAVL